MTKLMHKLLRILIIYFLVFTSQILHAQTSYSNSKNTIKIGFIGSLSSFAANYGSAVLDGVRLAISELENQGIHIDLRVEDDQSTAKETVSAYIKLKTIDKVQAIITGTWWANAIVKQAENDEIILLSCETQYNEDEIIGKSYFILNGDLRKWIQVYSSLIKENSWKKASIIRYVSGFGATLENEMRDLFSNENREFVGALQYNDINLTNPADIVFKLKKMNPDVVYIDAQPGGLANLMRKFSEAGLNNLGILTNSIAEDVKRDNLFDTSKFKNLYYTKRATYDQDFIVSFKEKFQKEPYLNSDLGYYAVFLAQKSLGSDNPVSTLKQGLQIKDKVFSFDEHNVYSGIPQEVYKMNEIQKAN